MTSEEYQNARKALGYTVPFWIEKLGISKDTHKSYNSGRRDIPVNISNHIKTLIELKNIQKEV